MKIFIYRALDSLIRNLSSSSTNNRIKTKILQLMGASIGKDVSVDIGVIIRSPRGLIIGNNVVISSYSVITAGGGITIEDNVLIGYGCKILSLNHKIPSSKNQSLRYSGHDFKKVHISRDAWIASDVTILPGVEIGEGAVIAAGSVVTKNILPYTINAGVPCKIIKYRE